MSETIPLQDTHQHQINTSPEFKVNDLIDGRFAVLPKPNHLITRQERESKEYKVPIAITGHSHVYLTQDIRTREDVVVKLHHDQSELGIARHNRERVLAEKLSHANIIPVVATGIHRYRDDRESPYIATMYADKGDLRRERVDSPEQARKVLRYLGEAALAMGYLHDQGIVHRDVKPANIVHDSSRAYLGDFGIADAIHLQRETTPLIHSPVAEEVCQFEQHTKEQILVGTLAYLSPQRGMGEPARPADDVFAWGASAFEELANRSAFSPGGKNTISMLPYFGAGEPVSADHLPRFIPNNVVELVFAAIEQKPENRPRVDELVTVSRAA